MKKATQCSGGIQERQMSRGFLLIEMLVYIAVLLIVSVVVVGAFVSLRGVFASARANHILTTAAETSLERMVFESEDARQVNIADSVFGSSPGSLTISNGTDTRTFYLSGTQLRIKENGVDAGPLTPPDVSVENLVFTHYQNTHTEAVRVSLTLHIEGQASGTTRTFSTMTLLRNSYE